MTQLGIDPTISQSQGGRSATRPLSWSVTFLLEKADRRTKKSGQWSLLLCSKCCSLSFARNKVTSWPALCFLDVWAFTMFTSKRHMYAASELNGLYVRTAGKRVLPKFINLWTYYIRIFSGILTTILSQFWHNILFHTLLLYVLPLLINLLARSASCTQHSLIYLCPG